VPESGALLERQRVSSRAVLATFCDQQTITWARDVLSDGQSP